MDTFFQNFLFEPGPIVWVQRLIGLGHPLPFRLIGMLASTWGALFALGFGLWLWGREDAYALAAILVVEALVNLGLNQLFDVPRPDAAGIVKYERVGLGSFPSGHVFTVATLWGLLWARGRVPFWLAALLVLGVGVARLYLGVHYLADVVGGLLLGALLVRVFQAMWPAARGWLAGLPYALFVGAGLLVALLAAMGLPLAGGSNHFLWNAAGAAVGTSAALLLEHRRVRFTPGPPHRARAARRVAVGLLGLVPLAAVDRFTGEGALHLGAGLAALGALWALLLAPALFCRWGWAEREETR